MKSWRYICIYYKRRKLIAAFVAFYSICRFLCAFSRILDAFVFNLQTTLYILHT